MKAKSKKDFVKEIVDERTKLNPAFKKLVSDAEMRRAAQRLVEHYTEIVKKTHQQERAQARLNRAAAAWLNQNVYLHDERYVPIEHLALVRAIRAFEKVSKV